MLVSLQFAMVHTKSESHLTTDHAESVKTANGQDIFQTTLELNVFSDHSLNVIASLREQLMDMLAKCAQWDK
jgi:hypothetical protein